MLNIPETREEITLISKIARRSYWDVFDGERDHICIVMDLDAAHASIGLRLPELLEASDADFSHDLSGIAHHLNRTTGQLEHCFVPRYAKSQLQQESNMDTLDLTILTKNALDFARDRGTGICCDQAAELVIGCHTWAIFYAPNQRGQMTRWPGGRGAVFFGGDSDWGDWYGDILVTDSGVHYDMSGAEVSS